MPEGPETKRMVDAISKSLVGKEVISHRFFHKELLHLNSKKQITIIDGKLTKRQAITAIKNKLRRKSELMILKDGKKKKL